MRKPSSQVFRRLREDELFRPIDYFLFWVCRSICHWLAGWAGRRPQVIQPPEDCKGWVEGFLQIGLLQNERLHRRDRPLFTHELSSMHPPSMRFSDGALSVTVDVCEG